MIFKLFIQNLSGDQVWEVPFVSFSLSEELNKSKECSITMDRAALDGYLQGSGETKSNIFEAEYREAKIYDEEDNLLFYGFVDETQSSGGKIDAGTYNITCRGFLSLFSKRFTNALRTYTSTDSSDIAWDLINYTQSLPYGDFGITRGADPTTINRQRTMRYSEILKEIEGMSNEKVKKGFDFDIDNLKQFNVYYPQKGSYKPGVIFERGHNIDTYSINRPGLLGLTNQVLVFGEGLGEDAPVETRDAEDVYKEKFFLLQTALSEKDVSEADTLQDKGDAYLADNKFPRNTISLVCDYEIIEYEAFDLGDYVKTIIPQENINGYYRVIKKTLTSDGEVYITVYPI